MSDHYYFTEVDGIKRPKLSQYDVLSKNIHHLYYRTIYRVSLVIETLLPVHIGSGEVVYSREHGTACCIRKHIRDNNGRLYIPASSMKGALTTYYHALFKNARELSELFGAPGYQSRVVISDYFPLKEVSPAYEIAPMQYPPRKVRQGLIKLYKPISETHEPVDKNTKLECIPKGVQLRGEIVAYNSSIGEIAKILVALGYPRDQNNYLLVGYGKGKGFGKIKTIEAVVSKISLGIEATETLIPDVELNNAVNRVIKNLKEVGVWDDVYRAV